MGFLGKIFKPFKWIKPEDSKHMTKIPKHDKLTSLMLLGKETWLPTYITFSKFIMNAPK